MGQHALYVAESNKWDKYHLIKSHDLQKLSGQRARRAERRSAEAEFHSALQTHEPRPGGPIRRHQLGQIEAAPPR